MTAMSWVRFFWEQMFFSFFFGLASQKDKTADQRQPELNRWPPKQKKRAQPTAPEHF